MGRKQMGQVTMSGRRLSPLDSNEVNPNPKFIKGNKENSVGETFFFSLNKINLNQNQFPQRGRENKVLVYRDHSHRLDYNDLNMQKENCSSFFPFSFLLRA